MSEIVDKFLIENGLDGKFSFENFNKYVVKKLEEMNWLCDEKTAAKLVLKDMGIKPVKMTRYVYKEFCPRFDNGEEVDIPDDAIGIMHWVDKGSDVDIYPILSWYEPVRNYGLIDGLTEEEWESVFEMELENMDTITE